MVEDIVRLIHRLRLPLSDEKAYQEGLSKKFIELRIPHVREHRLKPGDIIDFLLPKGLGIEIKLKGSARQIYAQLERYCGSPEIQVILLATNRAMGLPPTILGKPVYYASLGRAFL